MGRVRTVAGGWIDTGSMKVVNVLDFDADSNGGVDSSTEIQAALDSVGNGAIVYFPPGVYKINSGLTVGTATTLVGAGRNTQIKAGATMTYMLTYRVSGGEGRRGGMSNMLLDGDAKASWGVLVDTWHYGKWDTIEGIDYTVGMFHLKSDQSGNGEFCKFYDCELQFVDNRTPRFAKVEAGSAGTHTEAIFRDCSHIGINNGGSAGIDASGISTDTSGIGIELVDANRCVVDSFMTGNNAGTDIGSFDCSVYIHNRSGAAGAPTNSGAHLISNVYCEQGGTPDVKAKTVIVDGTSLTSGRSNRHNIIQFTRHSRVPSSGWTDIHFKNSSSTNNLNNANTIIQPKGGSGSVADSIIIDANVNFPAIIAVGRDASGLPINDSGTNPARSKSYHKLSALVDEATPSILGKDAWLTGGTTAITDFDDGFTGQIINIVSEHSVTITDGTNIFLSGSADFDMTATDTLTLIQKADGKWYELSRSVN